jgi:hypothetical protein
MFKNIFKKQRNVVDLSITKSTVIHDDQIFKLRFETDEGNLVNVSMSESRFQNLAVQCAALSWR